MGSFIGDAARLVNTKWNSDGTVATGRAASNGTIANGVVNNNTCLSDES
jgi:hypothetical protein